MRAVLEKIFRWAPAGEGFRRLALPALLAGSAGVVFWTVSVVYNTSKLTSRTAGQDVDLERESLAGLNGLFVLVEYLGDEEQGGGLREDALHTYLEMRLRQARIPVLSEDEWSASERRSYLYLNVHGLRVVGVWVYRLDLRIKQGACIEGWPEGQEGLLALQGGCSLFTTWDQSGIYTTGSPLPDSVRGNLADLMDQLVNDYLTVNPQRNAAA